MNKVAESHQCATYEVNKHSTCSGACQERHQRHCKPSGSAPLPTHHTTSFSDIVIYAMQAGIRQIFRRMPMCSFDYQPLCETLKSRVIDVLVGRKLRDKMEGLGEGKHDCGPYERKKIEGSKNLARGSAFRFLYIFILDFPRSEASDQNLAHNATTFAVSHRRISKHKTRKMV